MNKKEAIKAFEDIKNAVLKQYGAKDKAAMRTAWNDYTDALNKEGSITDTQYQNWTNPFN